MSIEKPGGFTIVRLPGPEKEYGARYDQDSDGQVLK